MHFNLCLKRIFLNIPGNAFHWQKLQVLTFNFNRSKRPHSNLNSYFSSKMLLRKDNMRQKLSHVLKCFRVNSVK